VGILWAEKRINLAFIFRYRRVRRYEEEGSHTDDRETKLSRKNHKCSEIHQLNENKNHSQHKGFNVRKKKAKEFLKAIKWTKPRIG
jgi:hypothetical protein